MMITPSGFSKAGIHHAQLACGIGALTVSNVVFRLVGYDSPSLTSLSLPCVWHDLDAAIRFQQAVKTLGSVAAYPMLQEGGDA